MKIAFSCLAASLALVTLAVPARAETAEACPGELQKIAKCQTGVDQNGAHYLMVMPEKWNGTLIVHAHGGPRLSPVSRENNFEDLERFAVNVRQGYAWAATSYRRPGYGVRMAAEDTENLRKIFVKTHGKPARTILHGQSWGGNVAAKGIELYAVGDDGSHNYDGVVLTNGMLAGGTLNYLHRADLRAVYQFYCNNHPRPDEAPYPLWMGLPADSTLTRKELEARVNDCTGVKLAAAQRSEVQKQNLANILGVIHIPERTLVSHLEWATFTFRDLVQRVLGGRNPFSNRNVVYQGSSDDKALNQGVARFDADPEALAQLAADSDPQGKLAVPVITLHAIDDPIALVEYESQYRSVVARAGNAGRLLQNFTAEHEHGKLSDAEYAGIFDTLLAWIASGKKPDAEQVSAACEKAALQFKGGCHFDGTFAAQPLFTRVAPRGER